MKYAILFTAFLMYTSAQAQALELEHLQVERLNDSYIDVYIARSPSSKPKPLVLMLQGSTCDSGTDLLDYAAPKWRARAAFVVVEKIGVQSGGTREHCSATYYQHSTIYQRVYDYGRVIQHLRAHAPWWNGRLYIVGGSEGVLIGAMLANYFSETEKLALIVGGGSMTLAEALPIGFAEQARRRGMPEEQIEQTLAQMQLQFEEIRQNPRSDLFMGHETYKHMASALDLRPVNALVDLTLPIYMVHGTQDTHAPVEAARRVVTEFEQRGKCNLDYHEYEGLDHALADAYGNSRMAQTIEEVFIWFRLDEAKRDDDARDEADDCATGTPSLILSRG